MAEEIEGRFKKGESGNPNGRPKGTRNKKTLEWEALQESITGRHAESFNENLSSFMDSDEPELQAKGMEMYIKVLSHFKPKYSSITHEGDGLVAPISIIIKDKI